MISFKPNILFIKRAVQALINRGDFNLDFQHISGDPALNTALEALLNNDNNALQNSILNHDYILLRGSHPLPDTTGTDTLYTIPFGVDLRRSDYLIAGSLVGSNADYRIDNNVFWTLHNFTNTGFDLSLRETATSVKEVRFDYIVFKP